MHHRVCWCKASLKGVDLLWVLHTIVLAQKCSQGVCRLHEALCDGQDVEGMFLLYLLDRLVVWFLWLLLAVSYTTTAIAVVWIVVYQCMRCFGTQRAVEEKQT